MKSMFRIEFAAGIDIEEAIIEAMQIATRIVVNVVFNFNGVIIIVTPISLKSDIFKQYNDEMESLGKLYKEK